MRLEDGVFGYQQISRLIREHWPEYAMEAGLLAIYIMAAGIFAVLLQAAGSPFHIGSPFTRRFLYGAAMGATSTALIYSPWGRQSGAHANAAVTFTYWRLGKIKTLDALFYAISQFAGGVGGVFLISVLFGNLFRLPPVRYAATQPGAKGVWWALTAEFLMSFLLMSTILAVTNRPAVARYAGLFTGFLVAIFLTFEAPLSGMSMNPARSFAAALPGGLWQGLWVYFLGPITGMLLAAEVRQKLLHAPMHACAKIYHDQRTRCIFCGYEPRP